MGGKGTSRLADDYPGGVAPRHEQLDNDAATPTAGRRASGAFAADGSLVAMTSVEVDGADAETDFTVVHPSHRGRGIGTALKVWSVLALQREGVRRFRTGGSAENVAIQRANAVLGYVQDEEWVTLAPRTASTRRRRLQVRTDLTRRNHVGPEHHPCRRGRGAPRRRARRR
ncbi:GNAT family N-acetyltransferase [Curtobacterium sp. RHCJP20]|uniref:GNAT family N-acetyltransferase n=1 Tax=Curtobacterium subtropicum TaxID=3055138 RepID=A0ABT7TEL7_9MICO|nr:GNAT family N-acetyltransferase [Curtobacterium subtropicum]MDM7888024.1 GNAT family N-acetyltransferase [Curtobacterium subtropicum]